MHHLNLGVGLEKQSCAALSERAQPWKVHKKGRDQTAGEEGNGVLKTRFEAVVKKRGSKADSFRGGHRSTSCKAEREKKSRDEQRSGPITKNFEGNEETRILSTARRQKKEGKGKRILAQ